VGDGVNEWATQLFVCGILKLSPQPRMEGIFCIFYALIVSAVI